MTLKLMKATEIGTTAFLEAKSRGDIDKVPDTDDLFVVEIEIKKIKKFTEDVFDEIIDGRF